MTFALLILLVLNLAELHFFHTLGPRNHFLPYYVCTGFLLVHLWESAVLGNFLHVINSHCHSSKTNNASGPERAPLPAELRGFFLEVGNISNDSGQCVIRRSLRTRL